MIPAMGLGLLGSGVASAHGLFLGMGNSNPDEIASRQQAMFSQHAQVLGVSVDEIKNAWAQGKTLADLAKEKGITQDQLKERLQKSMKDKAQAYLQALVDKGIITKAQADQRAQFMDKQAVKGKMGRGIGHGFGHGPKF